VTRVSVNPSREQSRSALAGLLSGYAREQGLAASSGARLKRKGSAGQPSAREKEGGKKRLLPEPDITWLENGRPIWRFYLLPQRPALRRLCPDCGFATDAVVCADSADNVGIIQPSRLLGFLAENATSVDKNTIHALARDIPTVSIPPPQLQFTGRVRKNHQFVRDHFSLCIRAGRVQKPAPGQFLQLLCDPAPHAQNPKYRHHSYGKGRWPRLQGLDLVEKRPFLRRPFSIASYGPPSPRDAVRDARCLGAEWVHLIDWVIAEFEVLYRRLPDGAGTTALANSGIGAEIDVVGPLGRGFTLDPLPEVALLVGGGIGAPPLLFLADELVRSGVEVKMFLGGVTRSRIPFRFRTKRGDRISRFERMGLSPVVCTDDGSAGYTGLVTDALVDYLEDQHAVSAAAKVFACGPRPMLAALNGIAVHYDIPCEVLLEERMACGFGACISCVCAVKATGQKARFTRICTEGPAFDADAVMWHA
jgi:dihydroorotate dehydrogenase electron transfer subunit